MSLFPRRQLRVLNGENDQDCHKRIKLCRPFQPPKIKSFALDRKREYIKCVQYSVVCVQYSVVCALYCAHKVCI